MTVRINKQKINLREKLTEFEDKVNFDEVVRGLGEYTGNVGIGVTVPGSKFHIRGDGSTETKLTIDSETNNHAASISFKADSERAKIIGGYDSGGGGFIKFNTDTVGGTAADRMIIDNAGNVGIGTTNPGNYKFLVNNSDGDNKIKISCKNSSQASLFFGEDAGGGNTPAWVQRYGSNHATKANKVEIGSVGSGSWVAIQGDSGDILNVRGSGNVGIGVTSPGAILHTQKDSNDLVTGLLVSNYKSGHATGNESTEDLGQDAKVSLNFGLARNTGPKKTNAGRILVGKEQAWTNNDLSVNTFMSFGLYEENVFGEKMRITSDGNVGIGTTTPGYPLAVHQKISGNLTSDFVHESTNQPYGVRIRFTAASPNNKISYFLKCQGHTSPHEKMVVWSNGDIETTLGNSIGTLSDIRTKDSVVDATPKLSDVMKLRVVNFTRKDDPDKTKLIGFVAQEVEEVFPRFVASGDNREYDEDGNVVSGFEDVKSVKFDSGFAILTKAIQEQQAIIEDLKSRIETLESK